MVLKDAASRSNGHIQGSRASLVCGHVRRERYVADTRSPQYCSFVWADILWIIRGRCDCYRHKTSSLTRLDPGEDKSEREVTCMWAERAEVEQEINHNKDK